MVEIDSLLNVNIIRKLLTFQLKYEIDLSRLFNNHECYFQRGLAYIEQKYTPIPSIIHSWYLTCDPVFLERDAGP